MSSVNNLGFTESDLIGAGAEPTQQEIQISSQDVQETAKLSLDFLAALAMPLIYKYAFPAVFLALWNWLTEYASKIRDFSQLALGLPRGFGKTAVIKLFILFCILFAKKKFILIICETEAKAINILSDIIDMLEEPNIKAVFGDWKLGCEVDTQKFKKFGFRGRDIVLLAAGALSGIRGITVKNERPDLIIFDDIQSREVADSQVQSEALLRWMIGTAMKAKSPHGCMFLFVANMYPTKWSILRQLKENPTWIKFIAGGILEDGTSLWEDLQPIEQLIREFKNDISIGRPDIFYAEVLNDETASANNLIDLALLPELPYSDGDISSGNFVIIDPSRNKKNSDATAIGYFEMFQALPCMRGLVNEKLSPLETIEKALAFCFKYNCRLIAIESVAYQGTLKFWFDYVCNQRGIIGIECVEIYPGSLSKTSRIIQMLKGYARGEIFVDPDVRPEVHMQIIQFNPLKEDNVDDILDVMTYPPKVIELYGQYIVTTSILVSQDLSVIDVQEFNSPF